MLQIWTYDIEPNVDNYCNNFLGKNKTILLYKKYCIKVGVYAEFQ